MNYIGSKNSLLDFLTNTIEEVTATTKGENVVFADLFAGTGIVGATFKKKGYTVISNDIQHYSYVVNKHNIENNDVLDISLAKELDALKGTVFLSTNACKKKLSKPAATSLLSL